MLNDQEYTIWSVVKWGACCRMSKGKFFYTQHKRSCHLENNRLKKGEEITYRGFSMHCPAVRISGYDPARLWSYNGCARCFQPGMVSSILSKSLRSTTHVCPGNLGQIRKYSLKVQYGFNVNASDRKSEIRVCTRVSIYSYAYFLMERKVFLRTWIAKAMGWLVWDAAECFCRQ